MIVGLDINQPIVINNLNTEVLAISVDKLENKLHKLIPKVDKTSNWISAIGIFVAIVLGIASYACVDVEHRPSLGLVIPLLLIIFVALGMTIVMLYKSHCAITVEQIINELKKEDSIPSQQTPKPKPMQEQRVEVSSQPKPSNISQHLKGSRKKRKGKR